ncbi:MAG: energy transducer TonB [Chitinophagaceae bacterium]
MSISFGSLDSSFYLQLTGSGLGANVLGEDDQLILLLENDSTITLKSTGLQTYDVSKIPNTYKHEYTFSLADLEKLSQHDLRALRKYRAQDFDDVYIPKENYDKIKKLSSLFIEEFKLGVALHTIQSIDVKDVAKHVGDSVTFIGKITEGKYLPGGKSPHTLLIVEAALPKQLLTIIIPNAERKNFGPNPENFYQGKEARITGRVQLNKEKLQIVASRQSQLFIMEDTASIVTAKTKQANVQSAAKKDAKEQILDSTVTTTNLPGNQPPKKEDLSKAAALTRPPAFPGGYVVWVQFLNRNLKKAPESEANETKTVVVQFVVNADGDVNDFQIKQSAGPFYDGEVLRVLKRMPKWKPAIKNGQPADDVVTQSVTFLRAEELKSF